jgi:Protein of unknown function (DUF2634).
MSLDVPITITDLSEDSSRIYRTYALNLDKGRISGMIDGIDAVNQFIRKSLITPRFKCLIYDNQFGSEIKERITENDATREYIESELPRLVKDSISYDPRIIDVYDFEFEFVTDKEQRGSVRIQAKVSTIYGETVIDEVI